MNNVILSRDYFTLFTIILLILYEFHNYYLQLYRRRDTVLSTPDYVFYFPCAATALLDEWLNLR